MAKISNAYTPLEIELVRGSTETIRLNVKEALPSTAWMDLTGSTVIFRAASKSDSIRKEIVSFNLHEGVACGVSITLTAAETRKLSSKPWDWECEYRISGAETVFAGGTITGIGGTNDDII
jgi:hypothetical protein